MPSSDAQARLEKITSAGGWTAHVGLSREGEQICSMGNVGAERSVFLYWARGDKRLTFGIYSRSWNIPRRMPIKVAVWFDDHPHFVLHGFGGVPIHKDGVLFVIKAPQTIRNFIDQFRTARQMHIGMNLGDERTWVIEDMNGSDTIAAAFSDCIRALTARVPPWWEDWRGAT